MPSVGTAQRALSFAAVFATIVTAVPARGGVAETGHVAVVQHDGSSYARERDGSSNNAPRRAAAAQFYRTHSDSYDFLVVFPTFSADFGSELQGLCTVVRNDVTGTGVPAIDAGESFGSPGRLKGYIDLTSLAPGSTIASLEPTLAVLAHEAAHLWSGQVKYLSNGQVRSDLLGAEGAHWSFFLDSDASVLYGAEWSSRSAGAFAAVESMKRYSALDLYLMGMLAPEEVGPITLLRPAAGETHGANALPPAAGTTVSAAAEQITISQIVAASGPRSPGAAASQKVFRAAFLILTAPGQQPTAEQLAFVDAVRREWANRFFFLTRGRAVMETDLVEAPPSATVPPSASRGFEWLLARQQPDGSWSDASATRIRDTELAIEALALFSDARATTAVGRAASFLAGVEPTDADSSARRLLGLAAARRDTTAAARDLDTRVTPSGVGLARGYRATPFDTALAAAALGASGTASMTPAALDQVLGAAQGSDGSWSFTTGGPGRIEPTSMAVSRLAATAPRGQVPPRLASALAFLASRRQPDGSYVDDVRTAGTTARAFTALAANGKITPDIARSTVDGLLALQRDDGSWATSVSQTALAVKALRVGVTPNLEIRPEEVRVSVARVTEGQPVSLTVTVRNGGLGSTAATLVRAYDADGRPFGEATLGAIEPGRYATITVPLDTNGHAGSRQVFAVADPENRIDELREDDNRVPAALEIAAPPLEPDLYVTTGSISVVSGAIDRLPVDRIVSAVVGNQGRTSATAMVAAFVGGRRVGTITATVDARSVQAVDIPVHLSSLGGAATVEVRVDPDGLVIESREDNNAAEATLPVTPAVDLAVLDVQVSPTPAEQGSIVTIAYDLWNGGTVEATANVQVTIRDGSGRVVSLLPAQSIVMAAGLGVSRTTTWRATAAGPLNVEVRAAAALERNPADDVATATLFVNAESLPNLAIRPGDLTVTPNPPLQSQPATARVIVRNDGGASSGTFAVELRLGAPGQLGAVIARHDVSGLAPGESVELADTFTPSNADRNELVVHVDPADMVPEVEEADNAALVTLDPAPIPDLVVGTLDVRPETTFPREGIELPVVVSVLNSGGQDAANVPVELFLGTPESGGKSLGVVTLASVPASHRADASFTVSTQGLAGIYTLVALVNADRKIVERRYDDDRASRTIVVQDGPIAVTERVISPNGDGIKDSTAVYYRSGPSGANVGALVIDRYGRIVRTLQTPGEGAPFVWDGLREDAEVAWDGDYDVRVAAGETVLGVVRVAVDTNRSQVHDAAGTALLAVEPGMQEKIDTGYGNYGYASPEAVLPDEKAVIGGVDVGVGLYEWTADGRVYETVRPSGQYSGAKRGSLVVAPDGDRVAYLGSGYVVIYSRRTRSEVIRYPYTNFESAAALVGFTADSRYVIGFMRQAATPSRLVRYDAWSQQELTIDVAAVEPDRLANEIEGVALSPDGRRVSYYRNRSLVVANIDGSERRTLASRERIGILNANTGQLDNSRYTWPTDWARYPQSQGWISDHEIAFADRGPVRYGGTDCLRYFAHTNCYIPTWTGISVIDLESASERVLFRAPEHDEYAFEGISFSVSPHRDALVVRYGEGPLAPGGVWNLSQLWTISTVTGEFKRLMGDDGTGAHVAPGMGAAFYTPRRQFSPMGTFLWSEDNWKITTLANLRASVSASRPLDAASLVFTGTAADLHFEEYELAARRLGDTSPPTVFARSREPVIQGELARWTPPAQGTYEITLTARDQGGSVQTARTTVGWSDAPAVSSLTRVPEYLSPNGDGIQDAAVVGYAIASPVTTEFRVLDDAGTAVRRWQRTHQQPGNYSFEWDGRGDGGQTVGDGRYVLSSAAGDLGFTVDTVAPSAAIERSERLTCQRTYAEVEGSPFGAQVPVWGMTLSATADDANLATCSYEAGPSGAGPFSAVRDCGSRGFGWTVAALEARGVSYRVQASDRAGNEAVSASVEPPEMLMVAAIGGADAVPPEAPGAWLYGERIARRDRLEHWCSGGSAPQFAFEPTEYVLSLDSTISAPLISYSLAYRPHRATGPQEPWTVDSIHVRAVDELTLVWDARELPSGAYDGEVRAIDLYGREFTAPFSASGAGYPVASKACVKPGAPDTVTLQVTFIDAPASAVPTNAAFLLVPADPPGPVESITPVQQAGSVLGREYVATVPLTGLARCAYKAQLVAADDPFRKPLVSYLVNVCGIQARQLMRDGEALTFSLAETFPVAVTSVDVFLWTNGVGQRLLGTVPGFQGASPPLRYPVPATECGGGSRLRLVGHLADGTVYDGFAATGYSSCEGGDSGSVPCSNTALSVALRLDPVQPPVCTRAAPAYSVNVHAEASTGHLVTGVTATSQNVGGGAATPVSLAFQPAPRVDARGALSTGLTAGPLVVTAQARDSSGATRTAVTTLPGPDLVAPVSMLTSPTPGAYVCAKPIRAPDGDVVRYVFEPRGVISDDALRGFALQLTREGSSFPDVQLQQYSGPQPASITGSVGGGECSPEQSGDYVARLVAADRGGSTCSDEVHFHLNCGAVPTFAPQVAPSLFSPDGDGQFDVATLALVLQESAHVTVVATSDVTEGVLVDAPLGLGPNQIALSNITTGGRVLPDGRYALRIDAADPCGSTTSTASSFEIDTQVPMARIDAPAPGAAVGTVLEVRGEATDANLASYELSLGVGPAPVAFTTLAQVEHGATGLLGSVSTAGLAPGLYTLRLQATDRVGHVSASQIQIQVEPGALVEMFDVSPGAVSPNGDGVQDQAAATFQLRSPALAWVEILDRSEISRATVLSSTAVGHGPFEVAFDPGVLALLEDGVYDARLTVLGASSTEVVTRSFVVDRVPPTLEIARPVAGAFVAGHAEIDGVIADPLLVGWEVRAGPEGSLAPVAQGRAPIAGRLAAVVGLGDGRRQASLTAVDAAGNVAAIAVTFSSDTVSPTGGFAAPEDGAVLGESSLSEVLGFAEDANLERWTVSVDRGGTATQIQAGIAPVQGGLFGMWDLEAEPDGAADLVLKVADRAGHAIERRVSVTVDRTDPVAHIDGPRDEFLKIPVEFRGTASDANLVSWTLELSDGVPGIAYQFSPLASGTGPVSGVLATLGSLPGDGVYTIRLTSMDRAGHRTVDEAAVEVDTTPPAPPDEVAAAVQGGSVTLTWRGSSSSDVAGYRVLRGSGAGPLAPVGAPVTGTTYSDAGLADGEYRYAIVTIDRAGLESAPSPDASALVDITPPAARISRPTTNQSVGGTSDILGTAFSDTDFKEYRLSIGPGATPSSFTLLSRSAVPVSLGALGVIEAAKLTHGASYTLRLETEDRSGNVGEARVVFKVDNVPPAAPVLKSAVVQAAQVTVTWNANIETDLKGYLLYRDGALVNGPGDASVADYTPYLIAKTTKTYYDVDLPDGTHRYQLQAVDTAGNLSALSNTLSATVERRAPVATVVSPAHLSRFEGPLYVVADAVDDDVASVQFEVRAGNDELFTALGPPALARPFVAHLDPAAFASPVLEIRAVARDTSGKTDPAPLGVVVFHDAPLPTPVATALADQGAAVVSASDSAADRVVAWRVSHDGSALGPVPAPTGTVTASISAPGYPPQGVFDNDGSTHWIGGSTFPQTLELALDSPTTLTEVAASLYGYQSANADVWVRVQGTWVPVSRTATGNRLAAVLPNLTADGVRFVFKSTYADPPRVTNIVLYNTRAVGLPYRDSGLQQGLRYQYTVDAFTAFGGMASASASAAPFALSLDPVPPSRPPCGSRVTGRGAAPDGSVQVSIAGSLIGEGNPLPDGTFDVPVNLPVGASTLAVQSIDRLGNRSFIAQVAAKCDPPPSAAVALSLAGITGADVSLAWTVEGDISTLTGLLVRRVSASGEALDLKTLAPTARSYVDAAVRNGTYRYVVVPVNGSGFEGAPSNGVNATISVQPPPAPASLAVAAPPDGTLSLIWNYSGPAAGGFAIERAPLQDGPYSTLATASATSSSYVDGGVAIGSTYYYRVRTLDLQGNASAPSNIVSGTPFDLDPPPSPVLDAPTVAGSPIAVQGRLVTVGGVAPGARTVELFRNGSSAGIAAVSPVAITPKPFPTAKVAQSDIDVSADGRRIVYAALPDSGSYKLLVVEDVRTHAVQILPSSYPTLTAPRFSPDGRRVAAAAVGSYSGTETILIADLNANTLAPLPNSGGGREPAWSPDSRSVAYWAPRSSDGSAAIVWQDLAEGVEHLAAAEARVTYVSPAWAGNGTILAFRSLVGVSSQSVVRIDLASGARSETLAGSQIKAPIAVSPAGDRFAAVVRVGQIHDLRAFDLVTGTATSLTNNSTIETSPVFSPDGTRVAYFSSSTILLADVVTAATVLQKSIGYSGQLAWSRDGGLFARKPQGTVERIGWGEEFSVPSFELEAGENVIVAVASDANGVQSAPSAPIAVTWLAPPMPDLAVSASVQPLVPIAGEPASALVTVKNAGRAASAPTTLLVSVAGSDGSLRVESATVSALLPGATTIIAVPLDLRALVGPQTLWAVADPSRSQDDADRTNDTATLDFVVSADSNLSLTVTAEAHVQADGHIEASCSLANPGLARDITVGVFLEDAEGRRVLDGSADEVFAPFPAASTAQFTRSLEVGTTYAGEYRVVAEARADDVVVARALAPVSIDAQEAAELRVVTSRAEYRSGESVELEAFVRNTSRNAAMSGAVATFEILAESGNRVFGPVDQALPLVWTGGEVRIASTVPSGGMGAGRFSARVQVRKGETVLAQAEAPFAVVARPLLAATIALDAHGEPPSVAPGAALHVAVTLTNRGDGASIIGQAGVVVVDELASVDAIPLAFSGSLLAGAATTAEVAIPTQGRALGTYGLSVVVDHDGRTETLATTRFRVADVVPPELELLGVTEGMVVPGQFEVVIRARDDLSGVRAVTAAVGGQAVPFDTASGAPIDGLWSALLLFETDGPHEVVLSAADRAGNDGASTSGARNPIVLHVVSDTMAPSVRIDGVPDGGVARQPVAMVAVATDAHLARVEMVLDGQPYVPGTPITTEGSHVLRAVATDAAGNSSVAGTSFVLDWTPPAITIAGVEPGAYRNTPAVPVVGASDTSSVTLNTTLDGLAYIDGTAVTAEGRHVLAIGATDAAGNTSHREVEFFIDRTLPSIIIEGIAEGEVSARTVVPECSVTDLNLATSTTTLDGHPWNCGVPVDTQGPHLLEVTAVDRAGNTATASRLFTIDTAAPTIRVDGVADGEVVNHGVLPVVTVEDPTLAEWDATLDGLTLLPGILVTTEGPHELFVSARDGAGNEARETIRFEIDTVPPEVWASVEEGAVYSDPVLIDYGATDQRLASLTATLNGTRVERGFIVAAEGPHILEVTGRDSAGNVTSRSYRFSVGTGRNEVVKYIAERAPRVLARVPCDAAAAERAEIFLREALGDAPLMTVNTDVDLLVAVRSGFWNVVVLANPRRDDTKVCVPVSATPPTAPGVLATRLEQEITEAVHRGLGLVVFRTDQAAWPKLDEALGLRFMGQLGPGMVSVAQSAVAEPARVAVLDGVELKPGAAWSIGTFESDGGSALALHAFGRGAAVTIGFDPSVAVTREDARHIAAGAFAFVTSETEATPRGVLPVVIEVKNVREAAETRVRETLDGALEVLWITPGGQEGPSGGIEWVFHQERGQTDRLGYLVRLPDSAGEYETVSEVARLLPTGPSVFGTYPLTLSLAAGVEEELANADRIASAIGAQGADAANRKVILERLASVRGNAGATAEDRERAIADLLAAIDAAKVVRSIDTTTLRLTLDTLLARWEAQP